MYLGKISAYWDTRADGYSKTIHEQLKDDRAAFFRDKLQTFAPEGSHLDCLDVGCGPGFFSILLAQEQHRVTATDYSEKMLEQAESNFAEEGVAVKTVRSDAQHLPFENKSFDYIVSRNLVWNLEEPEKAYREWLRLLRPGGHLLVMDGNHYLYYYDDLYRRANRSSDGTHGSCYGVDPTPINEIARNLPLSHERRPEWDLHTLLDLGVGKLQTETYPMTFLDPENGEAQSVISDFLICAEKPGKTEEIKQTQREINNHWSGAAENYSRIVREELQSFRADAWSKLILENIPAHTPMDILDVGCGPAFFTILLSRAGHRTVGVDGADGMLAQASQNAAEAGMRPLFLKGDCHRLPFADGSFDLVVSRNVTHALREQQKAYCEWFRVLRPNGVLLIFDANWHLMQTDPEIRREFAKREALCFQTYGSNFSADHRREVENPDQLQAHRLGRCIRPDWDLPLLKAAGYRDVSVRRDITDGLWSSKEKLLYGATPMFMIRAVK